MKVIDIIIGTKQDEGSRGEMKKVTYKVYLEDNLGRLAKQRIKDFAIDPSKLMLCINFFYLQDAICHRVNKDDGTVKIGKFNNEAERERSGGENHGRASF